MQESAESILTLAADAEETHLLPVLGRPLFDHIDELYQEVALNDDWYLLRTGRTLPNRGSSACARKVVVYMTLADNAGLLRIAERCRAEHHPPKDTKEADEKRIDRFVKDAFKKGHRAIDRLLIFLEEGCTERRTEVRRTVEVEPILLREPRHAVHTAVEFNRYVNIDESREWFVKLLPDIRFCRHPPRTASGIYTHGCACPFIDTGPENP